MSIAAAIVGALGAVACLALGYVRGHNKGSDEGWRDGFSAHQRIIRKVWDPEDRSIGVALRRYVEMKTREEELRKTAPLPISETKESSNAG